MSTPKAEVAAMLSELPESSSFEDIQKISSITCMF